MEENPKAVCGALSESLRLFLLFSYARNRDHFFLGELIWSVEKVTRVSRGYVNNSRPRGDKFLCYFCIVCSLGNRVSGRIYLFLCHSLASFSVPPLIRLSIYRSVDRSNDSRSCLSLWYKLFYIRKKSMSSKNSMTHPIRTL